METKGIRIHGVRDLRMDTFELPEMQEDEILARIVTDSLCLSTYKVAQKGSAHKKLPDIPGGKKVCYTHKSFPLTAVENIQGSDEFSKGLQEIIARHGGLWTLEAEKYFLEHGQDI